MHKRPPKKNLTPTSWQPVEKWYRGIVGEEGHYYHQQIIMPSILRLLSLKNNPETHLIDFACGEGVLGRYLPKELKYTGVDISPSFIKAAKKQDVNPKHHYLVSDITKPIPLEKSIYTHATIVLAIQNIEHPSLFFKEAARHLCKEATFIIVMNHPYFRIPRQSSWEEDNTKKLRYRRIERYFSPLKIPIQTHPSKGQASSETWSFHYPLSSYFHWLREAGFVVKDMEEWCSNKVSTGPKAKMENRSREEFPLFLALICQKDI
jgi:ubiquinone/menaquinone biosynthesis C-methylase UbiE